MDLIYMVPFWVNKTQQYFDEELKMAQTCLRSLSLSGNVKLIIFNQGDLTKEEIDSLFSSYDSINYDIIGSGVNVGIPKSRYKMTKHILDNYSNTKYVAEIHLDMIFPPDWHRPLIQYLEESDEPVIGPRILRKYYDKYYLQDAYIQGSEVEFPNDFNEKIRILQTLAENKVTTGFVHPVIHRVEALKHTNYYDPGFLTGDQGFEDTSILIGYRYYMGTKTNWKPKCCFSSCVFHQVEGQRLKVIKSDDQQKNLDGLISQYGAYGIKEFYTMFGGEVWLNIFQALVRDPGAYN